MLNIEFNHLFKLQTKIQLRQELGFTTPTVGLLVTDQGMDDIEELKLLSNAKVDALVKAVRHPGGITGAGDTVLGKSVSMQACTNLKPICYFICYQQKMLRA